MYANFKLFRSGSVGVGNTLILKPASFAELGNNLQFAVCIVYSNSALILGEDKTILIRVVKRQKLPRRLSQNPSRLKSPEVNLGTAQP